MDNARVSHTETPYRDEYQGTPEHTPYEKVLAKLAILTTGYTPDPAKELEEKSYYDYPSLKSHAWGWEIIWYFFLGGLAAGSYVIASIASFFGSKEDRQVVRFGYYLSLLTVLACPILLIKDLGRPERFLNMFRVFKFKSPMSVGSWGLSVFSIFGTLTVAIQVARDGLLGRWWGARLLAKMPQKLIAIPGTLLATFVGGYTSVLLSATSIAVWNRSRMLGVVFVASAFSSGTALTSLVLRIVGAPASALHKLEKFEWFCMLVEIVGLLGFLRQTGRASKALVGIGPEEKGRTFWPFMFGGGLVLPWLLTSIALLAGKKKHFSGNKTRRGGFGMLIALIALIGGYFLRKTVVEAGPVSGDDARTSLWNARR
ncbi:MAG TPA: NrfD/PsrC family molybdoenzyme membrane anchor subunit [Ktedonobacteraceae bacterium]|jgi:formate-dependent nitrite reductase membrane component NrfD